MFSIKKTKDVYLEGQLEYARAENERLKAEIASAKIKIVQISREEFDLLSIEQDVTYYIAEKDGSVTVRKGENK